MRKAKHVSHRRRRTYLRRARTAVCAALVAGGGWWAAGIGVGQRVAMTPVTVASEPVLPGPLRPPDPAPTTTAVPVTPPEYHPNSYESVPPSTTVGRTATSVEAAVRPTTTSTVSTTTTVARLNTTVAAAVGSCGPYPYTACIPLVGNRATWSCIIQHESGGNPAAVEPHSGAGGIFQFLGSTWRGLGYPGVAQTAAIATQIQAAAKLYLQSGFLPWVSDGCVH